MTALRLAGQCAPAILLLAGTAATAETTLSSDILVDGGVSTNPYGSRQGSAASGTASATLAPTLVMTSPTGSTRINGRITHTQFTRRYNSTTDYTLSGSTAQQISPLASFTLGASYSSRVRDALYPVNDPITGLPDEEDDPIIVDPDAAASYELRTETANASAGLSYTLSPRDTLNFSARATRVTMPPTQSVARGYDSYGGGVSYMRAVSGSTSIGAGVDINKNEFRSGSAGGGTVISPNLIVTTQLAPRLSFNASGGITFSETDVGGVSQTHTSFAGSAGLCYRGERGRFCLNGSRRVSPTSVSGTSTATLFGASYSYKLTPRSNINLNASYSQASSLRNEANRRGKYGRASVTYSRQILERLSGIVSFNYSDTYDSIVPRDPNFSGTVGLRYSLGRIL
ncbi:hypothetical protein [Sphingobium lignivorans]|uniref:Uncharacterized protein n=1 Tax=Sphingobium lignivorans TaxID=2735886 RepID=A0ABR6NJJ8_9SPHN|nr:hypothetical protein [Sphingobium lignivorans]MBB5987454.1 hypothetical protein [Sphingobium lignivorans]